MLDAGNPEQAKTKKTKPQSKPPQRFWPFAGSTAQTVTSAAGETVTSSPPSTTNLASMSSLNQTIVIPPGACEYNLFFFLLFFEFFLVIWVCNFFH